VGFGKNKKKLKGKSETANSREKLGSTGGLITIFGLIIHLHLSFAQPDVCVSNPGHLTLSLC